MRGLRFVLAGVLAAGMVVVAQAQPGQGFGFGGFSGPTFLVANKAVQEDLKLSEEQVTKLKDWGKSFEETAKKIREDKGVKRGGGFGKVDAEQQEKRDAANAEIRTQAYKQLGDVLKKEQVERIKQIERRQLGIRAFANAEVVSTLKLTDGQKDSVKGVTADYQKASKEIRDEANKDKKGGKGGFGFGRPDPETQKKLDKLATESIAKIVEGLDDNQKKTWKALLGDAFDTSKLVPNFGPPKKD